jgi:glycosyltransferase involved in cell wall biosynthesis
MLGRICNEIVFPFLGLGIGGSHISTLILADALREQGGFSCVFVCPQDTPFYHEAVERGFCVVPSGEPPADKWSVARDLKRLVSRRRLLASVLTSRNALVHCNDLNSFRSWMVPARSLSLPIVYHHRSLNVMTKAKRLLLSRATHAICVSNTTYESLAFMRPERRTQVYNPFATDLPEQMVSQARGKLKADLGLCESTRVVGFIANFWTRKRPLYFVDVARDMLRKDPNLHFAVYGAERQIAECALRRYVAEQGLSGRVAFLGFCMPPETNVASLDLLVAPAMHEPFGRTLIEAALVGVPYVATDDAGHGEIARTWGGGVLVGKDEPSEAFAAAALDALAGAQRIVLDEPGRHKITHDLSVERHARNVGAVYSHLFHPAGGTTNHQTDHRTA